MDNFFDALEMLGEENSVEKPQREPIPTVRTG